MQVSEIMNKNVVSISPEESASFASRLLSRYNIGALPVCTRDGRLRGLVTDRDIVLRCVAIGSDPAVTPVKEIMSRSLITASPRNDVSQVSGMMATGQIRRLPVVEGGKLVGIVSLGDLARSRQFDMEAGKALSEISANIRTK